MENIDLEIEQAYRDWQQAISIFNNAVEKEDIEYAIYNLEAKKRLYMRLLKKAQEHNVSMPQIDSDSEKDKKQNTSTNNLKDSSLSPYRVKGIFDFE